MPTSQPNSQPDLDTALLRVLAYAAVFETALSMPDLRRYLECAVPNTFSCTLAQPSPSPQQQANIALKLQQARRYSRWISKLPGVRMIALTGSLAMENIAPESDIDFFIVTQRDRVWLTRLAVVALVRIAAFRNITLCPNYFLAEHQLPITRQNLYVAREIAQMVPLFGMQTYQQFRSANAWVFTYLPNAHGAPAKTQTWKIEAASQRLKGRIEALLSGRLGDKLEQWEMTRKIRKFRQQQRHLDESNFSAVRCKGHFELHQQHTLDAFETQLARLETNRTEILGQLHPSVAATPAVQAPA